MRLADAFSVLPPPNNQPQTEPLEVGSGISPLLPLCDLNNCVHVFILLWIRKLV